MDSINETENPEINQVAILDRSRELLKKFGWIQGRFISDEGFCLAGALNHATYQISNEFRAHHDDQNPPTKIWRNRDTVETLIFQEIRKGNWQDGSLTVWNDQPGRTKEEVISVLDKVRENFVELG